MSVLAAAVTMSASIAPAPSAHALSIRCPPTSLFIVRWWDVTGRSTSAYLGPDFSAGLGCLPDTLNACMGLALRVRSPSSGWDRTEERCKLIYCQCFKSVFFITQTHQVAHTVAGI